MKTINLKKAWIAGFEQGKLYSTEREQDVSGLRVSFEDWLEFVLLTESELLQDKIETISKEVSDMNPYKQSGNRDSFSRYNEGWSDACDVLEQRQLEQLLPMKENEMRYKIACIFDDIHFLLCFALMIPVIVFLTFPLWGIPVAIIFNSSVIIWIGIIDLISFIVIGIFWGLTAFISVKLD